jgi:hypothetical protein
MSFLTTLAQSMEYDTSTYDSSLFNDSAYNTTTTQMSSADAAAAAAAFAVMMGFVLISAVIGYVVGALLLSRIFKKAGVEPWKAWVPIYNTWVMLELGDQKGYWAVLMLIPVVNLVALVFLIIAEYKIGLKLGKEGPFVLLAIFLPIVWLIWLAVDKSTWQGAKPVAQPATAGAAPAAVPPAATPANDNQEPPVPPQTPPAAQ